MVLKTVDRIRGGIRDALTAGEEIAERLALAEVDQLIQTRVSGILIPTMVIAAAFAVAETAAYFINDTETLRISVTSILLAAGIYGTWSLVTGIILVLPVLSVWLATRVGPRSLARLLLYELIRRRLREALTTSEGSATLAGRLAGYVLKFSGHAPDWDTLAFRLADRIAPRLVRHAVTQTALVLVPVVAAWAYYRYQVVPDIIHAQTGLGFWSAFVYPIAALIDVIGGTELRAALLQG
jgi:hypothetical protein